MAPAVGCGKNMMLWIPTSKLMTESTGDYQKMVHQFETTTNSKDDPAEWMKAIQNNEVSYDW